MPTIRFRSGRMRGSRSTIRSTAPWTGSTERYRYRLAKTISDASFGEFVRQLTYKSRWYGVNVVKIDRWDPSSKTCSACGWVYRGLKLSQREWTCMCCCAHHDRDYNASVNIKSFGLMALPPDRREVKPVDCPPVDDRRSSNVLRSSDRMNQEKVPWCHGCSRSLDGRVSLVGRALVQAHAFPADKNPWDTNLKSGKVKWLNGRNYEPIGFVVPWSR